MNEIEKYSHILDEIANNIFKNSTFELKSVIGQGSYGRVYEVRDKSTGGKYAAKLVVKATFGETNLWPLLQHPNVLPLMENLLEVGVTDGYDAYLMPYVGADLFHLLHERVPNFHADVHAYTRKKKYVFDVLKGIEYMHGKRLCHLDIKEENILICERTDTAIICDFSTLTNYQDVQISKFGLHLPSLPPEVAMRQDDFLDGFQAEMWTYGIFVLQISTKQYLYRNVDTKAEISYATDILPVVLTATKKAVNDFCKLHTCCALPNNCVAQLFGFIDMFLVEDPSKRASASNALLDPFFADKMQSRKRSYLSAIQMEDTVSLLESLSIKEEKRNNRIVKCQKMDSPNDADLIDSSGSNAKLGASGYNVSSFTEKPIILKETVDRKMKYDLRPRANRKLDKDQHTTCYENLACITQTKYEYFPTTFPEITHQYINNIGYKREDTFINEDNFTNTNFWDFHPLTSNIQIDMVQKIKRHKGTFSNQSAMDYNLQPILTAQSMQFSKVDLNEKSKKGTVYKFLAKAKPNVVITRARKKLITSVWRKLRLRLRSRQRSRFTDISRVKLLRNMETDNREDDR